MPRDYNTSTVEGAAAHAASLAAPYDKYADYPGPEPEDLPDPEPEELEEINTYRDLLNALKTLSDAYLDTPVLGLADGEAYPASSLVYFEEDGLVDADHILIHFIV